MTTTTHAEPLLQARGVSVGYGQIAVVRDLDLEIYPGELVALLGPNGAGKTTTLMALSRYLPLKSGTITLGNADAARMPPHKMARAGVAIIPEQRTVISSLSVYNNLRAARCDTDYALDLFPELKPLLNRRGGLLSGGEQQMLTLARALARRPSLVLADELSLGLAPLIVDRLLSALRAAADSGVAVLLVEQHLNKALRHADRGYVLTQGRITIHGTGAELHDRMSDIEQTYLSGPKGGPSPQEPT